jgi:hypothetical protein
LPWITPGEKPNDFHPKMYWNDSLQRYEVWLQGRMVACCEFDVGTLQLWWDWVQKTYFGKTDKP